MTEDCWANRKDGMRCEVCIYYVPKRGSMGRCRRHAPTMSGFPVVFGGDWCGDHKLDEYKLFSDDAPNIESSVEWTPNRRK